MIAIQKGTKDVLPKASYRWHYVEGKARELAARFGFNEIRTPTFEATELFLRGVGETTDIVGKEMYTFMDKGDRSITLKPEGTAGVARAFIENGMLSDALPAKMYYITPVFRYEKPQSGRLREHHQFGAELYGSESPLADLEVIMLAKILLTELGINDVQLNINNIGCPACRKNYHEALRAYYKERLPEMCDTCKDRFVKNPLRILDCKEERCVEINKNAPIILDYLCEDCLSHHETLKALLTSLNVPFAVNPRIVRGLDYYTRTVFEFISNAIGAQGTVCGGGRYNNLVEEVGGKPTAAVGFGMGIERLMMVMDAAGAKFGEEEIPTLYVADMGAQQDALKLVYSLRLAGVSADGDLVGRSLKAQMKYADRRGYRYAIVLGEDEVKSGIVRLKNMKEGGEREVSLSELSVILQ